LVGEFRPGNLYQYARKCGNPKCQCANPDGTLHRGWLLTRKVRRKTRSCSIPESAPDDTRRQLDEHRRFLDVDFNPILTHPLGITYPSIQRIHN